MQIMKAVITTKYGPAEVLELREIEKPVPGDQDVLVRIHAATPHAGDWHLMKGEPFILRLMGFGFSRPRSPVLGSNIAGTVEAVGARVTRFKAGDEVFGGRDGFVDYGGGFAEFARVPEMKLALKPSNISFEEAAGVTVSASTALHGLRDVGHLEAGQKVLVVGASGGVGSYAVQIAKALGAEVTGVCSTANVELLYSLGADHVIDYKKADCTKNGEQYDLILDTAAYRSVLDYKASLSARGRYLFVGGSGARLIQVMLLGPLVAMTSTRKMTSLMAESTPELLNTLKELLAEGKIKTVIDRIFPLNETADAIRHQEHGHPRGKIVITV